MLVLSVPELRDIPDACELSVCFIDDRIERIIRSESVECSVDVKLQTSESRCIRLRAFLGVLIYSKQRARNCSHCFQRPPLWFESERARGNGNPIVEIEV